MSTTFNDQQAASKVRDIVERIAKGVVRRERPEPRIAKVYDLNTVTQTCRVLFAGDTIADLVTIKFAKNMTPVTYMALTYDVDGENAPGDIVRVWGKTGNYFLLDFIWGGPESNSAAITGVTALHNNPSFETVSGGVPTDWSYFWGSGTAVASSSDVFSGNYSLTVDTGSAAGGSKAVFSNVFSVQPGDSVTFSIWAKSVSGQCDLDAALMTRTTGNPDYFDTGNTIVQNASLVTLTANWVKYTSTFTVPSGHAVCRLHFRINQTVSGNQAVARLDLSTSSKTPASNQFLPSGTWVKEACNAVHTVNVTTLAGGAPQVVDGVTLATGMRVLVAGQTTTSQNGIYLVQIAGTGANGTWVRASDATSAASIAGANVAILNGTMFGGTRWQVTFRNSDTVGTSTQRWSPSDMGNDAIGFLYTGGNQGLFAATFQTMLLNATDYSYGTNYNLSLSVITFLSPGLYDISMSVMFDTATARRQVRLETWVGADPGVAAAAPILTQELYVGQYTNVNMSTTWSMGVNQKIRVTIWTDVAHNVLNTYIPARLWIRRAA